MLNPMYSHFSTNQKQYQNQLIDLNLSIHLFHYKQDTILSMLLKYLNLQMIEFDYFANQGFLMKDSPTPINHIYFNYIYTNTLNLITT